MSSTSLSSDLPASTLTAADAEWFAGQFDATGQAMEAAVLGKRHVIDVTLTCLVSGGHLLLEDYPGTGKTMLARALAQAVSMDHARIQFTPDLLPSDVTGVTVYEQHRGTFEFHPGPIFHGLILADEINRASPKTQAALLEVMEEGRVTVDGVSRPVPAPFMVIATQNPIEQAGTYRLPEAQLDRFLMRSSVGYPDAEATDELLLSSAVRDRVTLVPTVLETATLQRMQSLADAVHVDRSIVSFVRRIAEASRELPSLKLGLSTRGCLAFVRVAKTWALSRGRHFVVPEDIVSLAHPVLSHRLLLSTEVSQQTKIDDVVAELMAHVPAPEGQR